ncbi:hypothetical protein O1611_g1831 [Lasiodiplodia mahajangana]|uniref:Uncharacterized protein n=1 Tax=Lasiodiplodia mahajangana TaxID=1108764 RepID=A0ACC2JW98_9PEZI|nr:hypothetical protein O1611_g1831 [Lasiodiplodia mahajangana]
MAINGDGCAFEPGKVALPDASARQQIALRYWQNGSADIDGMLGGIPSLNGHSHYSRIDLQGSRSFLAKLGIGAKNGRHLVADILEGGAGIGEAVDVIEPVSKFTDQLQGKKGVRNIFNVGLEDWEPTGTVQYDLIWLQGCVCHLTDEQLIRHLKQCKTALKKDNGLIIIKENIAPHGADIFDPVDSTIMRQDGKFRDIFKVTGLRVVKKEVQKGFQTNKTAQQLFPVYMYALRPEAEVPISS